MYIYKKLRVIGRVIALELGCLWLMTSNLKPSESLLLFCKFLLFDHLLYFSEQFLDVAHNVVVHLVQLFLCHVCLLNTIHLMHRVSAENLPHLSATFWYLHWQTDHKYCVAYLKMLISTMCKSAVALFQWRFNQSINQSINRGCLSSRATSRLMTVSK